MAHPWLTRPGYYSSSVSLKCALRESGCRIGYEPTKMTPFWWSISRDTNVEVSALSPLRRVGMKVKSLGREGCLYYPGEQSYNLARAMVSGF